ncbi:MAG: TetR/AcrR family transcriptional regulator [Trebonia sp.]
MATTAAARRPLNRDRIYRAALDYVDAHGLSALSLHKLGDALGVRAMSLYNHIDGKDDLLAGIVECLWAQIEERARPDPGWRAHLQKTGHTVRDVMREHPAASCLMYSQPVLPVPALRVLRSAADILRAAGFTERRAIEAVRVFASYVIGSTMSELCWTACGASSDERTRTANLARALPADVPPPLFDMALRMCGECDAGETFELGLELMLRGLRPGAPGSAEEN